MTNNLDIKNEELREKESAPTQKHRDSNFELLRIIAMFLIVFAHLCQHGLWFPPESELSFNYLLSRYRTGWLGNLLFMLISGYYMANVKFSWKKLLKLWIQIFSISAIIGLVTYFSKIPISSFWYDSEAYAQYGFFETAHPAGLKELIRSFFPCYFGNNWFATAYIVFYLFAPFCSKLFEILSEKQHRNLIILMFVVGSVISFLPKQAFFVGDNLFLFILCYCIADYIHRYNPKVLNHTRTNIVLVFVLLTFFLLWIAFSNYVLFQKIPMLKNYVEGVERRFGNNKSPFGLICAVLIFSIFKNMPIKNNRFINIVASTTFGVYLLHENLLINRWLWHVVFKMDDWISSPWLLPYMIVCVVIVFATCSLIELIRRNLFCFIGSMFRKAHLKH